MSTRAFRSTLILAGFVLAGAVVLAQQAADKEKKEAPAAPPPTDPNAVVITIGNQKITAGEFSAFVAALPPDVQELAKGGGRRNIGEEMVRMKLLSAQARSRKLDESPRFKQQMAIMADNVLVGLLLQDLQPTLASDDDVKKYYDEHKNELERVTARHILISTMSEQKLSDEEQKAKDAAAKAKAEEIRKKLVAKPDSFAEVAKAESQDPSSQKEGGELPPFGHGQMVEEFEKVAFSIKPGEISDVVKTNFGYHIIQVSKREIPPLDEVKDQVADQVRHEKFEAMYQDIKNKAKPQLDDNFFGPPPKPGDEKAAGDKPAEK